MNEEQIEETVMLVQRRMLKKIETDKTLSINMLEIINEYHPELIQKIFIQTASNMATLSIGQVSSPVDQTVAHSAAVGAIALASLKI